MKRTLILCVLVVLSYNVFGQTTSDSIIVKTISGGCKIYQGSRQLTLSQLAIAIQANDMAYQQVKKAQSNNTISSIIGGYRWFYDWLSIGDSIRWRKTKLDYVWHRCRFSCNIYTNIE